MTDGAGSSRDRRGLPMAPSSEVALDTCRFCPKLCRTACPVSNAAPRESLTPWGKMSLVRALARGNAPVDAEVGAVAWACSGCGACKTACELDNDVAVTLREARRALADRGAEASAVRRVADGFDAHSRATAEAARALGTASSRTGLFVGCTYLLRLDPEARAALRVTRGCLGDVEVVDACCGQPLLDAGAREAFDAHVTRLRFRLASFERVVFVDPGCARTLVEEASLARDRATLLVEEVAARLDDLTTCPTDAPVRYHDPCSLGRGLGIYDAPRALLTRIHGRAPLEFDAHREHAACSGGGGLLPITMPDVARGIASARLAEHGAGGEVVTACASSLLMLRRAASPGTNVEDLVTWVARALGG